MHRYVPYPLATSHLALSRVEQPFPYYPEEEVHPTRPYDLQPKGYNSCQQLVEHGKHLHRSAELEEAIDNLIETSIKRLHTNAIHR